MLHGEALAVAALLGDRALDDLAARRVAADCSRDMHTTLLTGDPAAEQAFVAAARQISGDKATLERALTDRCHALEAK
jgi:hypothetical protein